MRLTTLAFACLPIALAPAASAQFPFENVAAGDLLTPIASWGASFVDFDGDGDPDLFVSRFGSSGGNALYRNDGGAFSLVDGGPLTAGAGSLGHSWADADHDGDLDVLTTGSTAGFGNTGAGTQLFLNDGATAGGWAFRLASDAAFGPPDNTRGWSTAWADIDRDGRLDFVVAHPATFLSGSGVPDQPNHLFRQTAPVGGELRFERITDGPVVTGLDAYTVATWSDYDLDGDPDLFIGSGPATGARDEDNLYQNVGGVFERIASGLIATELRDGQVMNWQDIDQDGDLDLFVTNYFGGSPALGLDDLYRNDAGVFVPITDDPLTTDTGGLSLANTWGDVDNDGDLDVVVATGGSAGDRLYLNDGSGRFERVWTSAPRPTSGAALADIDGDGDLDLAVTSQQGGPVELYENGAGTGNAWVKLRLEGVASNRAAIGARVEVTATIGGQQVTQLREVLAQNTFNGHNDLVVHVGLGDAASVERVRVVWPSGQVDVDTGLAAGQTHVLREGFGTAVEGGTETGALRLGGPVPNPSGGAVSFVLHLATAQRVTATALDVLGRPVVTLHDGLLPAGQTALRWDGLRPAGGALPPGFYLLRVEVEGQRLTRPFVRAE